MELKSQIVQRRPQKIYVSTYVKDHATKIFEDHTNLRPLSI